MIECYKAYPEKEIFFDASRSKQIGNFDKLAGTSLLRKQIIAGVSEDEHTQKLGTGTFQFQNRKKNLLYLIKVTCSPLTKGYGLHCLGCKFAH